MPSCTEADFQKLKAKLIASGDMPASRATAQTTSKAVINAAANHAAMIETSISKAIAAVNASPAVALEAKPVAKVMTAFEQTVARVKAEFSRPAQSSANRAQPTAHASDLASRAKGRI